MFQHVLPDSRRYPSGLRHWNELTGANRPAGGIACVIPIPRPYPTIASANDFRNASSSSKEEEEEELSWKHLSLDQVQELLLGPNSACASLFAIDGANHYLYFTICRREDIDKVYTAPFLYQGQREHAQKLLRVPCEIAATQLASPPFAADHNDRMSFIVGVPRSGTTLLCKILEAAANHQQEQQEQQSTASPDTTTAQRRRCIVSLSEPDVLGELVCMRAPDGSNDSLIVDYLALVLPWICRGRDDRSSLATTTQNYYRPTTFVIKPRSEVNHILDLIQQAHERLTHHNNLHCLVSMRNTKDMVQSMAKLMANNDIYDSLGITLAGNFLQDLYRQIPLLKRMYSNDTADSKAHDGVFINGIAIAAGMWCSCVYSCGTFLHDNRYAKTIHFDTWKQNAAQFIGPMLQHLECIPLDQPPDPGLIQACLQAMKEDSQKGTKMEGLHKKLVHWSKKHDVEVKTVKEYMQPLPSLPNDLIASSGDFIPAKITGRLASPTLLSSYIPLFAAYAAMVIAQMYGAPILGLLWGKDIQAVAEAQDTSAVKPDLSMEVLCRGYTAAHFDTNSNIWHAAGMVASMILLLVAGGAVGKYSVSPAMTILLWIPPVYYLPAWVGHFGFQKDIPAVFVYGTTFRGWWRGEACAFMDLFQGGLVSEPVELVGTVLLSVLFLAVTGVFAPTSTILS